MPQNETLIIGEFTGTGSSSMLHVNGTITISVDFSTGPGSGAVKLQRSFDDGETWKDVETWTDTNFEGIVEEVASYIQYRFNCPTYTSGTIHYVLGA